MAYFAGLLISSLAPIAAITVTAFCNVCFADHADHAVHNVPWNSDWDERQLEYEDLIDYRMRLGLQLFHGCRYIYLIRPGQADSEDRKKLSCLGKLQSELVALRVRHLLDKCKCDQLIFPIRSFKSAETAQIIARIVPRPKITTCDLIHNGYPIEPVPAVNFDSELESQVNYDGVRLETAFRKHFYRPRVGHNNTNEIIVCPSNVIRYFICRVLQLPPEGWERMSLFNCSITFIQIWADGSVSVGSIGDFSHLPEDKITPALIDVGK